MTPQCDAINRLRYIKLFALDSSPQLEPAIAEPVSG